MDTPTRKQREFLRREQEILRTALHLFQRDDWEAVTIDQIAQEAGIGKGTVYKHFRSKPVIYARLALDFYQRMLERMRQVDLTGPLVARLRLSLRSVFDFHLALPEYRHLTQYCERVDFRNSLDTELRAAFDQLDDDFDAFAQAVLQKAIDSGQLPDRPVAQQILGIRATISGAFAFLWSGNLSRVVDNEALIEQVIDFMIAGLLHQHQYADPRQQGTDS